MISPAAGLPAYTMPPTGGAQAGGARPQTPTSGAPAGGARPETPTGGGPASPSWNRPSGTHGVGAPGGDRQPFGGSPARVNSPPAHHGNPGQGLSQQRGEGTVYGAHQSPIDMTVPVSMSAIENSGSLTGHILAQGWDRGVDTNRRSNLKVGIAMLLVLLFLAGMSLLFLFTAGDAFTDMVNDVFHKG